MAKITNSDTTQALIRNAGINTAYDKVPNELAEKVIPVISCEPKRDIKSAGITASDSVTATILTTSATKRTFIVGYNLSYAKDVNSTSLYSDIVATAVTGESIRLCRVRYEPLTAGQQTIVGNFSYPIEIARNTQITITNTTNVASIDTSAFIFYYEVDNFING